MVAAALAHPNDLLSEMLPVRLELRDREQVRQAARRRDESEQKLVEGALARRIGSS
jgi:hypothetical protein